MKLTDHDLRFKEHLNTRPRTLGDLAPDVRERSNYALRLIDIKESCFAALQEHGITWSEFEALGAAACFEFLESRPSRPWVSWSGSKRR